MACYKFQVPRFTSERPKRVKWPDQHQDFDHIVLKKDTPVTLCSSEILDQTRTEIRCLRWETVCALLLLLTWVRTTALLAHSSSASKM